MPNHVGLSRMLRIKDTNMSLLVRKDVTFVMDFWGVGNCTNELF